MSRDPANPPGGSRQYEPPGDALSRRERGNLARIDRLVGELRGAVDELSGVLEAEREAWERAEWEWKLGMEIGVELREEAERAQRRAEHRLDEAVKERDRLGEGIDEATGQMAGRIEQLERERDELHRLVGEAERALQEVIDDRDSAERRLDEAVEALREIAEWGERSISEARGMMRERASEALASIEATGADPDQPASEYDKGRVARKALADLDADSP